MNSKNTMERKTMDKAFSLLWLGSLLLLTACGNGSQNRNAEPVFTSPTGISVDENSTDTGYIASASDADGDVVSFSLSGGQDQAAFDIDARSGVLSFISPPDFEMPSDSDANNDYVVDISVSDGTDTVVQTVTIAVTNLNDVVPVFTSASSINVPENTTLTGYTATASDADGDTFTFRLTGGADRSAFALDINSGVLSFNNAPDFEAPTDSDTNNSYVVEITVTDGQHTVSQTVTVNVTNLNDIAPVFTSSNSISVVENNTSTGYMATATDVEGDTVVFSLGGGADQAAFSIDPASGVLRFNTAPDFEMPIDSDSNNSYKVDIVATDGNNPVILSVTVNVTDFDEGAPPVFTSGNSINVAENTTVTGYTATASDADGDMVTFSLSGGADRTSFTINTNTGALSFNSAPDFEIPTDSDSNNSYVVDITADDGINTVAQTVSVNVTNSNDVTPVFTSGGSISVAENNTATGYTAMATDAEGDTLSFSLGGGADQAAFSIDSTSGVLIFNTAPDFEVPTDSDSNNSYVVDISVSDGNNTVTQTLRVNVTNLNDVTPVFTSGNSISVAENITVTGYTATATDTDGDTVTFSLSGGADQAAFSIDSTSGVLSFNTAPDFEVPTDSDSNSSYVVDISASDGSNSVVQTVTVNVRDVSNEEPPVFTSGNSASVAENTTVIGYTATATDADGDTVTFSLSGGADQVAFSIDTNTGVLSFNAAPDFEVPTDSDSNNSYIVDITASDGSNPVVQTVTVTVTDVAEGVPPVFTSGNSASVAENTTVIGYTATATDADGDTVTFSLSGGADQAAFSIDTNTGVLSFNAAPDFEVPTDSDSNNSYIVDITASDGSNPVVQTVTVTVTDVTEGVAPVFTSGNSASVSENTTVTGYTATATDADGDTVTFSLSGGVDQAVFSIDTNSGVLSFNAAPDFEIPTDNDANNSYVVDISASDGTNTVTQTVTVNVTDVSNEAPPVFTSGTSVSVPENTTATGYTATATDADGDTLTFSLSGGVDQAAFSIDSNSGVLTFITAANFDTPTDNDGNNDYEVEISASDGSNTVAQLVTVNVTDVNEAPNVAATPVLGFDIKTFRFSWTDVGDATFYRLLENPDGVSGFTQISGDIALGVQTFDHLVALYRRTNASYILQSCNSIGCTDSSAINVSGTLTAAIGSFRSADNVISELDDGDVFGWSVSLSHDGTTLAVGAWGEDSNATGIGGDDLDNSVGGAGAVYIFTSNGANWTQQAYVKASTTGLVNERFGHAISLSADGNTLAVSAYREDSNAIGVNGDETNNSVTDSGAVYVYTRSDTVWSQQAYVKASNPDPFDYFGWSLSLSDDGNTLAVGAQREDSNGTVESDNSANNSGAVYVFSRSGIIWTQQAYVKASNTDIGDFFGESVSLSSNGNTLAVGAKLEDSNGAENDNSVLGSGAAYVFTRSGSSWSQQAYIKASNREEDDRFGSSISLSNDGNTLAVGAVREDSIATGIGGAGAENDNTANESGAVYVFTRSSTTWSQQAYIKASNTDAGDEFGFSLSLSGDGDTLAVGAHFEDSSAVGLNGDETLNNGSNPGAVYVFTRSGSSWMQQAYVKSLDSLTNRGNSEFGYSLSLSGDGDSLVGGAPFGYTVNAGAVFLY